MKIVTVNVQESFLEAIKKLIGPGGLYPSRSELVRVAVREFLLKELKLANNMAKYNAVEIEKFKEEDFDDENFVRVPTETINDKSEPVREFKQYKILKRLDYSNSEKKPKPVDHGDFTGKVNYGDSFDDVLHPSNYSPRGLEQLRKENPNGPYFKYINEGLK